ncbi:uncharacterized protein LOC144610577 [Rhinoraja longicauda]
MVVEEDTIVVIKSLSQPNIPVVCVDVERIQLRPSRFSLSLQCSREKNLSTSKVSLYMSVQSLYVLPVTCVGFLRDLRIPPTLQRTCRFAASTGSGNQMVIQGERADPHAQEQQPEACKAAASVKFVVPLQGLICSCSHLRNPVD